MASFNMTFTEQQEGMHATFGSVVQVVRNYDPYSGPYEITPSTIEQIMETKGKDMVENVTVREIPYYEISNEHGSTVHIAPMTP